MFKKLKRKFASYQEKKRLSNMFAAFDGLKTKHYPRGWNWIDRVYIEDFLEKNKKYICGDILEFKENLYATKFGHDIKTVDIVTHPSDINNKKAKYFMDISQLEKLPSEKYDCIICTQVLPFIYDYEQGIAGLHKLLKPGGHLLVSVPGLIALVATSEMQETGHFYGFSPQTMQRSFVKYFKNFSVSSYGNAKAAMLLVGFGDSELLPKEELLRESPDHIITVTILAEKE